ncbi:putative twin-arginine translocation pathway signal protein [Burkholderia pseudomallei]|nr:putative twin-arginine translocation pathway signal protein [Burkholderia pseudomallei]CAJ3565399.1 putative twin-arginine translocation pathway signal protein [Burkholderia pseudomallei]CAJ3758421.1 putative twin-arginine translocation pathway signal protein [Burkholderia pseudomallei]CAJ3812174.1 putative twin-arginine translocation pathway signal protein [Burkholderia pseudomallei]CAJ3981864.1 putative twin-arginine translocation pathway signal protein [Burkholderia pseudomallei]
MTTRRWAFALALAATGTAITLSILSGWQRGGSIPERLVWVAIGIVLVTSAHLLPALMHSASWTLRGVAAGLWLGCMAAAVYGHATFFLLAQAHAGERRAASVPSPTMPSGLNLAAVMNERAEVTAQLAAADVRRCVGDCPTLRVRRARLAAKLDALNAQADDVRRIDAQHDRIVAQRDALLADPVTWRVATLLAIPAARVELLSSLLFAAVLEGVACLLWSVSLRSPTLPAAVAAVTVPTPPPVTSAEKAATVTPLAITPVMAGHDEAIASRSNVTDRRSRTDGSHALRDSPVTPLPELSRADDEVAELIRDIAAGRVRATVADIRRHLGCSQARAAALRRQVVNLAPTA